MSSAATASLDAVEASVGHAFKDRKLLVQALSHLSAVNGEQRISSYQRLEFLGDRVLGLAVSSMLYEAFPTANEGEMSRRLAALVRRETCADVAREWDLAPALRLGDSEAKSGGRTKPAILSDVCEAVIGAIYLDAGYGVVSAVIRTAWTSRMIEPARPLQDPKTALQEWAQSLGKLTPVYRETGRRGPAHRPEFTIAVDVEGVGVAEGTGSSKRLAEQAAAEAFMTDHAVRPGTPHPGPIAA